MMVMVITKYTTDDEIMAPVMLARQNLATMLRDPEQESTSLMGFLLTIAEQEGKATARKIARNALADAGTKGSVNGALMNALMGGPDDVADRFGDVRRAHYKGFHHEAFKIMREW